MLEEGVLKKGRRGGGGCVEGRVRCCSGVEVIGLATRVEDTLT